MLVLLLCVPLACAQLSFTTIDVPGAGVTDVYGINSAGDMVGYYGVNPNTSKHAFLLHDGVFTFFDYPGASSTVATGVNDLGRIVGYATKGDAVAISFLYDGTTFSPIRAPGMSATVALGMDNAGDIVGGDGTLGTTRGFELRGRRFKDVSPPGVFVYVYATGINKFGEVVGWTDYDGFAYKNGKYRTIAFPGAFQTEAWDINDSGVIVGWYTLNGSAFGFALANGHYVSFAYPGALYTIPRGINADGRV
ncbi:MAG: hypothetical protein ACREMY_22335, partial [bacterium]